MKKFMTLAAFAAVALSAQAATVNWGLGADVYLMEIGADYTTAKVAYESSLVPDANSYLALVYVGQNKDSFDIADITDASVVDSAPFAVDTDGSTYADYDPFQITTQVSATTYSDGASFSVVWFNGTSFDYVYSIDDGAAINSATTFADMTRGSDSINIAENTNGYGGVLAVPEPGTASLVLAGLALLLKRRKA